jgi:hypothetical protein
MTRDSTEGFPTASGEEGRVNLPSPRRHDMGASTAQAMATIPPWQASRHQLPPRVMAHSSGGRMSTGPHSITLRRARGSAVAGPARWRASNGCDQTAQPTKPRALVWGGKNPDDRLRPVQAPGKREAPTASHEGGMATVAAAKALSTPPPPITNRMDKLYHQLVEIHAIATVQLAECAR